MLDGQVQCCLDIDPASDSGDDPRSQIDADLLVAKGVQRRPARGQSGVLARALFQDAGNSGDWTGAWILCLEWRGSAINEKTDHRGLTRAVHRRPGYV